MSQHNVGGAITESDVQPRTVPHSHLPCAVIESTRPRNPPSYSSSELFVVASLEQSKVEIRAVSLAVLDYVASHFVGSFHSRIL